MTTGFPACLPCPGSLDNAAWAKNCTQDILRRMIRNRLELKNNHPRSLAVWLLEELFQNTLRFSISLPWSNLEKFFTTETCFGVFLLFIMLNHHLTYVFLSIQVAKTFTNTTHLHHLLCTYRASPTPAGIDWGKSMWKRITNFPALEGSWRMENPVVCCAVVRNNVNRL